MEKHDLHHELPEFEKIHALIETTGVFSQMMS